MIQSIDADIHNIIRAQCWMNAKCQTGVWSTRRGGCGVVSGGSYRGERGGRRGYRQTVLARPLTRAHVPQNNPSNSSRTSRLRYIISQRAQLGLVVLRLISVIDKFCTFYTLVEIFVLRKSPPSTKLRLPPLIVIFGCDSIIRFRLAFARSVTVFRHSCWIINC